MIPGSCRTWPLSPETPPINARLFRYYDDIHANFFLGRAYLDAGSPLEASTYFSRVVQALPEYRPAIMYLAASRSAAKRFQQAASAYLRAAKMSQDPVAQEDRILIAFALLAKESPKDPARQHQYGTALHEYGHYHLALSTLRSVLELDSTRAGVREEIAKLELSIRSGLDGAR